jgi:hypothetical protein
MWVHGRDNDDRTTVREGASNALRNEVNNSVFKGKETVLIAPSPLSGNGALWYVRNCAWA